MAIGEGVAGIVRFLRLTRGCGLTMSDDGGLEELDEF